MRPHRVVMPTPGLDDDAGIGAVAERFQAQAFVPELAVEALPGAILPWLAGIDERGVDTLARKALQDCL